ncbi:MAG: hypothetical protein SF162_19510 [bacterium]|nr:hypothetical protein [bacterium]
MAILLRVFGLPHEALHALALLLIGRRAVRFTRSHVVIPDDLTTGEYVFVAALPGLVALIVLAGGGIGLLEARSPSEATAALLAIVIGGFGAAGALGDFHLIVTRLQSESDSQA